MKIKGKHEFEAIPGVNGVDVAMSDQVAPINHTHTITFPVTSVSSKTGDVTLDKFDIGLSDVDNTSDADKPVSTAQQTALNGKVGTAMIGVALGVCGLDSNTKVPMANINDALIGQVSYMGVWNASTNTPTLPSTPTDKGHYYVTSVAGTQFSISFAVGDWIISNGVTWDKVDNTDAVSSVAGRTGVVTLTSSDVGLGNVLNIAQAPATHVGSGGAEHADATTSVSGFMTAADKAKLNGVATGATANTLASATPTAPTATGAVGVSNDVARGDHAHPSRISLVAPASPVNGDIWMV